MRKDVLIIFSVLPAAILCLKSQAIPEMTQNEGPLSF